MDVESSFPHCKACPVLLVCKWQETLQPDSVPDSLPDYVPPVVPSVLQCWPLDVSGPGSAAQMAFNISVCATRQSSPGAAESWGRGDLVSAISGVATHAPPFVPNITWVQIEGVCGPEAVSTYSDHNHMLSLLLIGIQG